MHIFTIGYGGRNPSEFVELLQRHNIATVVDVRIQPNRASMGSYVRARSPERGIERLLSSAGIAYRSILELGNPFLADADWVERYRRLLEAEPERYAVLEMIELPFALLCAEKRAAACHRAQIAEALASRGWQVTHIE